MPYFGTIKPEFKKTLAVFEVSTFETVKIKSFMSKKKLDLGQKLPYTSVIFDVTRLEFVKFDTEKKL